MNHVLIAEDLEESRYLLQVLLEGNGYRVTTARDGLEALAAARREPPDVIVSDALMPGMDGFGLCRAWMQDDALRLIPFVFYSATYTDPKDERFALALGAVRYLIKPLETQTLLTELQAVLQESAKRPARGPVSAMADGAFYALHDAALARKLERKIAQVEALNDKLGQSERNYRQLFEANPQPMWVYDLQTLAFLAVNDAAIAHYGYSRQQFLAMTIADIRPAEDLPRLRESVAQAQDGVIQQTGGWRHRTQDGTLIDVEISSHPIDFAGRQAKMVAARDVTQQKRAEEQIQRYIKQLNTTLMSTVEVATTLSELRDPYTAGHERRVGGLAAAIGAELGLDGQRVEGLRVAGYLHDIGKMTIPTEILSKPGKLSPVELQLIRCHPQASYDVLKNVQFPWPVAQVALQHHERLDGSGYPQGLQGEAILLEARIMAVADVIEAMSSHRPYRPGLGITAALTEIERGRGLLYDAQVADACLRLFRQNGYILPV